jgi:ssDNA-binding Zn-finger/Zn-ribbon topoisomerase 1
MRNYKKVSECPPELEKIIELVNLMPPGADELLSNIQTSAESRAQAKETLDEKIIEYLFGCELTTATIHRPFNLIKAKNLLTVLSEMSRRFASEFQSNPSDVDGLYTTYLRSLSDNNANWTFSTHVSFDSSNGVIKPVKNELFEIFEKYKIPFYRIRSCPICRDFYWAKKTNSQSCGRKKCIDDLQNQKKKLLKVDNQKNNRGVKAVASLSKDLID